MRRLPAALAANVTTLICMSVVAAETPTLPAQSLEELAQVVATQQARIKQLEEESAAAREQLVDTDTRLESSEQQVAESTQRLTALSDYTENLATAKSEGPSWADTTQLGGYGELHYNNLSADDSQYDKKEIDFHRFVLYVNHQFNERLRLFSEVELEHSVSGDDQNGEVELEQAYLQYDLNAEHRIDGGLFLVPVGILNETHEPNTFYGVERNAVESVIIPTTWREGGVAVGGRYASGLAWDLTTTSGLAIDANEFNGDGSSNSNQYVIRAGRENVSEASANDLAYTGRLKYTGISGLEVAATYQYQADASQVSGDGLDAGQLISTHAIYQRGLFTLRALYAGWYFQGRAVKAVNADEQNGWYVEPSVKFRPGNYDIGIYARHEDVDAYPAQNQFDEWQTGVNYWPVSNVVLKFDYRERSYDQTAQRGRNFTGFDLGMGYMF
jgi:Skp family chaperone for outer membrane proteins